MSLHLNDKTGFYSQFSFLSRTPELLGAEWLAELEAELGAGKAQVHEGAPGVRLVYRHLPWDSNFFGIATYRVDYTSAAPGTPFSALEQAFASLRAHLAAQSPAYYLFTEVPAEDTAAIAGMSGAGWRLIETRVTGFSDELGRYTAEQMAAVRSATEADIAQLRATSVNALNRYDRFHADDFFTPQQAEAMLATFAENSVRGFADDVIVPAEGPADAFLTANHLASPASLGLGQLGRMSLLASLRPGWAARMICGLSAKFHAAGFDAAFITTQATNRAVLKVCSQVGFRIGRSSHIFSTYSRG
jgi:dTDP-4-amino-4,6-dideoxy-D-galactose acyltransferase